MEKQKLLPVEYVIKKLQLTNLAELGRIVGVSATAPAQWINRGGIFPSMKYKELLREYAKNKFDVILTLDELNNGGIL